jgi:hypothetical protein
MKKTLQIILFAMITGCATQTTTKQMSKDTRVCIFSETDDLLYTQVVVGEPAIQAVCRRIEKYLVNDLNERRIKTEASAGFSSGDAKLTVKINTIETVTTTSPGLWMPVAKQQPKIKFTATLLADDGTTLFSFDGEKDDESLDTATKKIADEVSKRVEKYYK